MYTFFIYFVFLIVQVLVWAVLLLLLVVFIAWPHVRQFLIDARNSVLYPHAPVVPGTPRYIHT